MRTEHRFVECYPLFAYWAIPVLSFFGIFACLSAAISSSSSTSPEASFKLSTWLVFGAILYILAVRVLIPTLTRHRYGYWDDDDGTRLAFVPIISLPFFLAAYINYARAFNQVLLNPPDDKPFRCVISFYILIFGGSFEGDTRRIVLWLGAMICVIEGIWYILAVPAIAPRFRDTVDEPIGRLSARMEAIKTRVTRRLRERSGQLLQKYREDRRGNGGYGV